MALMGAVELLALAAFFAYLHSRSWEISTLTVLAGIGAFVVPAAVFDFVVAVRCGNANCMGAVRRQWRRVDRSGATRLYYACDACGFEHRTRELKTPSSGVDNDSAGY